MSGSGWGNPVVGGTALRIPAIQSPNFSMANSTGWAIFADGSAFFFNVTVAGTITGGTLIVDGPAGGVFVYSGTPAAGNLIGSWAGAAGTDAFGNTFPAGFSTSVGAISGSVFSGTDFIINSAGIFIYSGTPAGPVGGTLTETAVTPQIVTAAAGVASSTNAFSPPAGSMVVVPVSWLFASNIGATVTCKDSLGTVYAAGPQVQDVNDVGISAVFTHVYAVAPGPVTVTVTCSNTGGAHAVLAPRVLAGQAASQAGAATVAATGGPSTAVQKSITTTKPGSLVYIAAETAGVATLTAIAGTATILADPDALVGDTGATGRTGATVTAGATTIGWTSTASNSFGFAALEVLPGSGAGNLIGSWAGQSGTDAFGNAYPQGLNVSVGTISGTSFNGTDFIINNAGEFFYSGTPATGNLSIAIAPFAATDPISGQQYFAGITRFGSSGSYITLADNGTIPTIFFQPGGAVHQTITPQVFSGISNAGAANEFGNLILTSGKQGVDDAALQLFAEAADATVPASAVFEFGGTVFATFTKTGMALPGGSTPPSAPGSGQIYATAIGTVQVVDGVDLQAYGVERRSIVTGGNQTISSTTFGTVASTPVAATSANRTYRAHGRMNINPSQAAGGFAIQWLCPGVVGPSSMDIIWFDANNGAHTAILPVAFINIGAATSINPGFVMTTAHNYAADIDGTFSVPAGTSTTFSIQFATPNAGDNYVILGGSFIEVMPV